MAVFNDACITDAGMEMTERLVSETGTLQFIGIAVGTGTYTSAEKSGNFIRKMTTLKKILKVYDINSISKKDGAVILKSIIENTEFTSSQSVTEIGLIASDGKDDILYSISVAEKPLDIPAYNGTYTYAVTQEAYVVVSRDLNITIKQPEGVYALAEDLQKYVKDLSFDKENNMVSVTRGDDTKEKIKLCDIKSKIKLLKAGQTSVTFGFDAGTITENSKISIEASVPDVNYESVTTEGDNVTVVFVAKEKDAYVKAVVTDAVV